MLRFVLLSFLFVAFFTQSLLAQSVLGILLGNNTDQGDWTSNITAVSDLNNDNYSEFAVGYPKYSQSGVEIGKVTIYSGKVFF